MLLHYHLTRTPLCSPPLLTPPALLCSPPFTHSAEHHQPWRSCSGFLFSRNERGQEEQDGGRGGRNVGAGLRHRQARHPARRRVQDAQEDIPFLERELRWMQILVNVLADMEGLDEVAKDWKGNMRDLSYDMEECIDRFMQRIGNGDTKPMFRKKTAHRLMTLFSRHGIGSQIKDLKDRVEEESQRRQRLKLDDYIVNRTRPVVIDPRLAAFHGVAKGLVAMDRRMDQVVTLLTEESEELKVVAIVGGGGLGKTTLAMETYRKIGGNYQCRASVSVSRTPDLEKLLKDVLSQIDEAAFSKCQSERWEKDQLIRQIQRILTGKSDYWPWENKHIIRNIGSFYQLRYLRMHGLRITELPADIGKLQNLETLDLRGSYGFPCKLPSTIVRLPKLVRLFIDKSDFLFSADMFGSMPALEEVSDICQVDNPEKFLEELGHVTKLRKISMSILWINTETFKCYGERMGLALNKLGKHSLQYLHTHRDMGNIIFRDPCCTFPHLQHLKLGYRMEMVPKGMASLTNILKLEISVTPFDEEDLHILMGMPSLAYLQLTVGFRGVMSPNRHTLQFHLHRKDEDHMFKDEELRRSATLKLNAQEVETNFFPEEVGALEDSIERAATRSRLSHQFLQLGLHRLGGLLYEYEEERRRGRRSATLEENAQEQQEDQVI